MESSAETRVKIDQQKIVWSGDGEGRGVGGGARGMGTVEECSLSCNPLFPYFLLSPFFTLLPKQSNTWNILSCLALKHVIILADGLNNGKEVAHIVFWLSCEQGPSPLAMLARFFFHCHQEPVHRQKKLFKTIFLTLYFVLASF